jgi:hypothetical protein
MPLIPATYKQISRGIWFEASPGEKNLVRLHLNQQVIVVVCFCNPSYAGDGGGRIKAPGQKIFKKLKTLSKN